MPPLLLVATVLFWGSQTEVWAVAVPVAIVLAVPRILPWRWDLTNAQLFRIADFCTVLVVLLAGYLFVSYGNPRAVVLVFQWLPLAMLPLALTHAYGTRTELDMSVLFWNLRRNAARSPVSFDPSFPYMAIWVLASSAANTRSEVFYGVSRCSLHGRSWHCARVPSRRCAGGWRSRARSRLVTACNTRCTNSRSGLRAPCRTGLRGPARAPILTAA
jgi:hypothetical protein